MNFTIREFRSHQEIIAGLEKILERESYIFGKYISSDVYRKYVLHRIIELYRENDPRNMIFLAQRSKNILGIVALKFAYWDSNYFKIPMGKIAVFKMLDSEESSIKMKAGLSLMRTLIRACKKRKIRHLAIRVDVEDEEILDILGKLNFKIVSMEGVNFFDDGMFKRKKVKSHFGIKIEKLKRNHIPQILTIAEDVAMQLKSRYHFDSKLPQDKVQRYYIENVINCCKGYNADGMIVGRIGKNVIGFLAYKFCPLFFKFTGVKKTYVVLFAIAPSERRKGVSFEFMYKASRYLLKKKGILLGRVYLHNVPMIKLLAKFKFPPFAQYLYCLHKWIQ